MVCRNRSKDSRRSDLSSDRENEKLCHSSVSCCVGCPFIRLNGRVIKPSLDDLNLRVYCFSTSTLCLDSLFNADAPVDRLASSNDVNPIPRGSFYTLKVIPITTPSALFSLCLSVYLTSIRLSTF